MSLDNNAFTLPILTPLDDLHGYREDRIPGNGTDETGLTIFMITPLRQLGLRVDLTSVAWKHAILTAKRICLPIVSLSLYYLKTLEVTATL